MKMLYTHRQSSVQLQALLDEDDPYPADAMAIKSVQKLTKKKVIKYLANQDDHQLLALSEYLSHMCRYCKVWDSPSDLKPKISSLHAISRYFACISTHASHFNVIGNFLSKMETFPRKIQKSGEALSMWMRDG